MTWEDAVRCLIGDPSQQDLVEACYFDLPLKRAAERYAQSGEWRAINHLIGPANGLAVDVGAGNGIVSYALARNGWGTVAIEPDPSELVGAGAIKRLARETQVEIDVRPGYGEQLPVGNGVASLVIARQVLHHARDLDNFCQEIARVLRPGGRLIAARDHVISGPRQLQPFLDSHPLHSQYGGENAFTLKAYRAALMGAGLRIEREIGSLQSVINYAPYTIDTLREEIAQRMGPLRRLSAAALRPLPVMRSALWILSTLDRRPGRLVSFVCRKE